MSTRPRGARLVSLCALGALSLSYPILSLFNVPRLAFGIPVLHAYLFGVWIAFIVLAALAVESRPK